MSTRQPRRSRRVPTTPSRFEDYDVGQPSSPIKKEASSPGSRSPRGSSSKIVSNNAAKKTSTKAKQATSKLPVKEGMRTLRSGNKRQVQQENVQLKNGSSSAKKIKIGNDDSGKKQTPYSKVESATVGIGSLAEVSGSQRENSTMAKSPQSSVDEVVAGSQLGSSGTEGAQSPASAKILESPEKRSPSEPLKIVAVAPKSSGIFKQAKVTPPSGEIIRVIQRAIEARVAKDKAGFKANQGTLTVAVMDEGSSSKYTIKILSPSKSETNTAEGQSALAETGASDSQPRSKTPTEGSPTSVSPKKNIQVDVIHPGKHVTSYDSTTPGLFASASKSREETNEDSSERMTILPISKGSTPKKDTSKSRTSKKCIPLKTVPVSPKDNDQEGSTTTCTQTSVKDFRTCLMVNSKDSAECAHKVMRVSTDVIRKGRFRTTDLAPQTKKSQTVSVCDDLNYHILEALGTWEENQNDENSLTFWGEDNCDADKKIQNMLFGQDLDVALSKSQQGIPSNVIADPQKKKKRKPKNANITMESWSIALAVMNPDV